MSGKKKARVIHVDKLIVHADDVVIVPRRRIHDPWLSSRRTDVEGLDDLQNEAVENETVHSEENEGDEGRRRFSWI
ncbi:hypothetical protein [Thermaerobacillus caldiproteolyticus]|uniref:Uncharacterized protein n=1 Tax=Thermaerobacillus caldiproteolyticus TaxID=247480 RepID=A0A7W0BZZ4_9BACL|nr:hypothetical protein [Anoxybacillus caldiproteolyticus]MBA2874961.1 hypothetical protein [Anoxybacillus caldiproteolyticus]QPA31759.1 hypothetical protein ISX45_01730 [Anoxybacillus caldiproteolyticus]